MTDTLKILFVLGMAGSGKSSCVEYIVKKHPQLPPILYFGGINLDEIAARGLEVNETNERLVRREIRAKEGLDSHAKRISKKIDQYIAEGHNRILADGLYSWSEYKFVKKKYGDSAIMLAVAAPRALRHARLANRPVRPLDAEQANLRDYDEIESIEKGGPIANADYTIVNNSTLQDLHNQLGAALTETGF